MRRKLIFFLFFLIVISLGFIIRIEVEPYDEEVFSIAKDSFLKKYYFFCDVQKFYKNLEKREILIKKFKLYPWSLYITWEEENTWFYIRYKGEEKFYNQEYNLMSYYKPTDNTIKINNFNEIQFEIIKEIVENISRLVKIKEITLYPRYFQIKTSNGTILMNYDNYKEKLRLVNILFKNISENLLLDLRFDIPTIRS